MAYTYKGTKITGTSTTAKVFKKSGIANAKANQTYFNTDTGHVYKCTEAGKASVAKWQYVRTDIAGKPKLGVKNLGAPKRTGARKMKATWKVPSELTNAKNGKRAQGLEIDWSLGIKGKDPKKVTTTTNESKTESTINLNNFQVGNKTYTRQSFYPFPDKPKLDHVTVSVRPYNSKGKGKVTEKATRNFVEPKAPSIAAFAFDANTGIVSTTITTDAGTGYAERYDTAYKMEVYNSRTGKTTVPHNSSSTSTSIPLTYNVADYQQLSYSQYVKITVTAYSRGFAGKTKAERTYYVSYPAQPSITSVGVSSRSSTGKCTAYLKTNASTEHPVDSVKLEYLANSEYSTASSIPGDASFTSTEIVDDGNCKAMSIGVAELIPDPGKYTWIRVRAWHAAENVLYRYSNYVRVTQLETPAATAQDERIKILSATAGKDGKSIVVVLGWNATGQDDATGTELTWSEESDTWKSTEYPEEHTFTWSDGSRTSGGVTYRYSATITIKNLEESTKYYIRARRYLEGDTTTYSPYSNTATCITSEQPESVIASCPTYISAGSALPVSWTFTSNSLQTRWQIVSSAGTVIANGEGSISATQISADRIQKFATNNSLTFTVQVSTGSGYVVSEQHTVTVQEPPSMVATIPATMTAQETFNIGLESDSDCNIILIITSQGAVSQFPDGVKRQTAGDTIYSDLLTPVWTEGETFTTTITLPPGLDFWDECNYNVSIVGISNETGLYAAEQTGSFGVAWAHQAPVPFDYVTITPIDEVDENGRHHQSAEIALTAPAESAETDVYDIYRLTGDGAYLIGETFPLTYTATDEYAPFGDDMTLYYRIACRTVDGDVAFSDIEYNAPGSSMRFDWAGGTLELPYNISIGDSYKKDVEIRNHMDGGTDAYWNDNIERTASLSSDFVRLDQQTDVALARQLARYPGAVFVRTPDGSAYEADVQVSDISTEGVIEAIALDATEIGLTQEFILPSPYPLVEEGE